MSWLDDRFGGGNKTYVGTQVTKLLDEKAFIASSKAGLINALFGKNGSIVENILDKTINSIGIKAETMYHMAKDSYVYGLPSSTVLSAAEGNATVKAIIDIIEGQNVVIDYIRFGPINLVHLAWMRLVNEHGYISSTNIISGITHANSTPTYLKDMQLVITLDSLNKLSRDSLDQWGNTALTGYTPQRETLTEISMPPLPPRVDINAIENHVLITYTWTETVTTIIESTNPAVEDIIKNTKVIHEDTMKVNIGNYPAAAGYYHVRYKIGENFKYWLYGSQTGVHPEIDAVMNTTPDENGAFFPIFYFRKDNQSMGQAPVNEQNSTRDMLKGLGLDYDAILDSIHQNADINQVDLAAMMFAVPANSTNPIEHKYLFDYFNKVYLESGAIGVGLYRNAPEPEVPIYGIDDPRIGSQLISVGASPSPRIGVTIQDTKFKMSLSCEAIIKKKGFGSTNKIGTYSYVFDTETLGISYIQKESFDISESQTEMRDVVKTYNYDINVHTYRYQSTDHTYDEIKVYDLKSTYYILGDMTTVGDALDKELLVPLDYSITNKYNTRDKEILYSRALQLVFNSVQHQHVAWYQTIAFVNLITVVAVAISAMEGAPEMGAEIAAIIAGQRTVEQVLLKIATMYLNYKLMELGSRFVVRTVGPEVAAVLAIAMIIQAGYKAYDGGTVKATADAKELLIAANGLNQAIGQHYKDALNGLQAEADEFSKLVKEKYDALEEINKELNSGLQISPFVFFGESPEDYYNRTAHSGNIGVLSLDSVHSYVDNALQLPKLYETI